MALKENINDDIIIVIPPDEMVPHVMLLADQLAENRDWGHVPLQLEECQKLTMGEGITVAVLDTGCDLTHPDLKDRIIGSRDFTGSSSGASDVAGHGTHCAGIIASSINAIGLIGVAPKVNILVGKVLGDNGSGQSSWIAAGIRWAVAQKANIISMSLGSPSPNNLILTAVREAIAAGVYVVAAAGNEGPGSNTVGYPGGAPECVCVAAVNSNLTVASFSSRGPQLDVSAPGVNILSTYPGGRYATMSGTSMATPYCAGVVALYLSLLKKNNKPFPSQQELFNLFQATCKDIDVVGKDSNSGFGLTQPLAMLNSVGPVVPPPTDDVFVVSVPELVSKGYKKLLVNLV